MLRLFNHAKKPNAKKTEIDCVSHRVWQISPFPEKKISRKNIRLIHFTRARAFENKKDCNEIERKRLLRLDIKK